MKEFYTIYILVLWAPALFAQDMDLKERFQYHMTEKVDEIIVDGILNEDTWNQAQIGTDFWQKVPYYEENADPRTEIQLSYDDKNLYIAAKCYQTEAVVITSLKRDQYWDNDGIAVVLDPLNTRSQAILFGTSAVVINGT